MHSAYSNEFFKLKLFIIIFDKKNCVFYNFNFKKLYQTKTYNLISDKRREKLFCVKFKNKLFFKKFYKYNSKVNSWLLQFLNLKNKTGNHQDNNVVFISI